MMPLLPGLTSSRAGIERTVAAIADAGLPLAGATVARLDEGVKAHFFAFLERRFPALVEGYTRLYPGAYARRDYCEAVVRQVSDVRLRKGL